MRLCEGLSARTVSIASKNFHFLQSVPVFSYVSLIFLYSLFNFLAFSCFFYMTRNFFIYFFITLGLDFTILPQFNKFKCLLIIPVAILLMSHVCMAQSNSVWTGAQIVLNRASLGCFIIAQFGSVVAQGSGVHTRHKNCASPCQNGSGLQCEQGINYCDIYLVWLLYVLSIGYTYHK